MMTNPNSSPSPPFPSPCFTSPLPSPLPSPLLSQWICVPFMMTNPNSMDITLTAFNETFQAPWVGKLELRDAGKWIDDFMVLVSDRKHTDARTDVGTHTHTSIIGTHTNLRLPSMLMMTLLPIVVIDEGCVCAIACGCAGQCETHMVCHMRGR